MTDESIDETKASLPEFIRDELGTPRFHFTTEDMKRWKALGSIPSELADNFFYALEEDLEKERKLKDFKEKFPNASQEEIMKAVLNIPRALTKEESEETLRKGKLSIELHEFLVEHWPTLEKPHDVEELDPLFKNINPIVEFGIVRFIADQMNHLPSLLEEVTLEQIGTNEYLIKAKKDLDDGGVKTLIFSHPITAQSEKSAHEIAKTIKDKLLGIRHKMWQACWLYANEVKKLQFSAPIHDLMKACYPNREAKFSANDKEVFYEELRLLRLAEFTLTGTITPKTGKPIEYKYNIPILRVGGALGEAGTIGGPPDKIFIDLCAITPAPTKEKMRFVAAPIKKRTLELNAQDCPLAYYLQVRKNQILGGEMDRGDPSDFKIDQLIVAAGLQNTYRSNPTVGVKRLLEKFARALEKEIISKCKRIDNIIKVWW
jgi:hypothetical protein